MKTVRKNRSNTLFDRLEPRRLMAVDLSASTVVPKGAYGADDLFDVDIRLSNSTNGSSQLPCLVTVTLSKDKILGNSDDITGFSGTVFIGVKKNGSTTQDEQVHVKSSWAAGDYYVVTQADPYRSFVMEESNTKNNVTFSSAKEIRIVTDKVGSDGIVRGTPKNDTITVHDNWANEIVTVNGKSCLFDSSAHLNPLSIQAGKGDDKITVDATSNSRHILSGNAGNDTIYGGNGDEEIWGDAGQDRLYAGAGMDTIRGGSSNDIIDGGAGKDSIFAEGGKDKAKNSAEDIFQGVETKY
jgi:Ca2+-binding RTX toxin-like protein